MKKLILILTLLVAGLASADKVTDWALAQKYTLTQLRNVTWTIMKNKAESLGWSTVKIRRLKGRAYTIINILWSDLQKRELEKGRGQLETIVHNVRPDAVITLFSYGSSSADPNNMSAYYLTEVPMDLERN